MGTPYYMSPEQVEGKRAVDFRTDLWAMAVITSECMTGVRPFDGSTFGELLLNICARPIAPPSSQGFLLPGFDEWFARATNRDAEQRFASAQDLVNALRDVVQGGGAPAYAAAATAPNTYAAGATTGAGVPTPGNAPTGSAIPSVSSINTAQEFTLPKRSSALPWILLVLVLLVGAVATTVLVLRPKSDGPTAENSAAPTAPAAAAALSAVALAAAPENSIALEPSAKPAARATPPASATHKDASAPPITPEPRPNPAPATATAPSPAAAAAKSLRCFSDPFSGQIRPAPAGRADTFGCRQDPFTGKYKRL
jgi:serine/threonine-protein kinase